jgi:hypothetical protein
MNKTRPAAGAAGHFLAGKIPKSKQTIPDKILSGRPFITGKDGNKKTIHVCRLTRNGAFIRWKVKNILRFMIEPIYGFHGRRICVVIEIFLDRGIIG